MILQPKGVTRAICYNCVWVGSTCFIPRHSI